MKLIVLVFFLCFSQVFAQKDPNFVDGRTVIVHLFEWKWSDIADECERFLQDIGYAAVQTSPPNENLVIGGRPWWERYQPVSYVINTRSGDEAAFEDMTRRCNAVGVRIYIDAVINHMTGGSGTGTAGNSADYEGRNFPAVPYGPDDFHAPCDINNWQDPDIVRVCMLDELSDLNQGSDHVRDRLIDYMNHLIDLGVSGFRVDAATCMYPEDLGVIYSSLKDLNTDHGFAPGTRPYVYQEVTDIGNQYVTKFSYTGVADVLEFLHALTLGNIFQGGNQLSKLSNWGPDWGLMESSDAVVFIDNHDTQRADSPQVLTYKTPKPYKMALAFMLAHPYGTTRIISSYDWSEYSQGPPADSNDNIISPGINPDNTCSNGYICEHRWREIFAMVEFRNIVVGTELENWWSNGDQQIAFSRGNKGFVAITNGGDINEHLNTGLPAGTYCDVISSDIVNGECTGRTITVGEDGYADVHLGYEDFDGAVAYHVNARL